MPADDQLYRRLLRRTLLWAAISMVLVVLSYYFVDRQVAYYVVNHGVNKVPFFKKLTLAPPWVQSWAPVVLVAVMICRARGPIARWELVFFIACVSLIVGDEFRESIGELCGRYWPETWFNNNPSLIGTDTYGFRPFHWGHQPWGNDAGSFPSGHAARISAFASVWWVAVPRSRILCVLISVPMCSAMVAMNYHFVSDVIAGVFIGSMVGVYAAALGGLLAAPESDTELRPH